GADHARSGLPRLRSQPVVRRGGGAVDAGPPAGCPERPAARGVQERRLPAGARHGGHGGRRRQPRRTARLPTRGPTEMGRAGAERDAATGALRAQPRAAAGPGRRKGPCESYIRYKTLAPIPLLPLQSRPTTLLATRLYAGLPCWKRIANTSPSAPRWVSPRCPSPPNKPPI